MQVNRIATMGVESVREDASVREAAEKMVLGEVGFLPVEHNGKAVGVLTDRDIVARVVAKREDPDQLQVRDVMTVDPAWIYEDAEIADAARVLDEQQVHRLLVLNREHRIEGVLSLDDIACCAPGEAAMSHVLSALGKRSTPAKMRRAMTL